MWVHGPPDRCCCARAGHSITHWMCTNVSLLPQEEEALLASQQKVGGLGVWGDACRRMCACSAARLLSTTAFACVQDGGAEEGGGPPGADGEADEDEVRGVCWTNVSACGSHGRAVCRWHCPSACMCTCTSCLPPPPLVQVPEGDQGEGEANRPAGSGDEDMEDAEVRVCGCYAWTHVHECGWHGQAACKLRRMSTCRSGLPPPPPMQEAEAKKKAQAEKKGKAKKVMQQVRRWLLMCMCMVCAGARM